MSYIHARCDAFESTLNPIKHAFKFSKYVFALANEIISVVHTGVKSLNVGMVCINLKNHTFASVFAKNITLLQINCF